MSNSEWLGFVLVVVFVVGMVWYAIVANNNYNDNKRECQEAGGEYVRDGEGFDGDCVEPFTPQPR